jgi:hypothetical protein
MGGSLVVDGCRKGELGTLDAGLLDEELRSENITCLICLGLADVARDVDDGSYTGEEAPLGGAHGDDACSLIFVVTLCFRPR